MAVDRHAWPCVQTKPVYYAWPCERMSTNQSLLRQRWLFGRLVLCASFQHHNSYTAPFNRLSAHCQTDDGCRNLLVCVSKSHPKQVFVCLATGHESLLCCWLRYGLAVHALILLTGPSGSPQRAHLLASLRILDPMHATCDYSVLLLTAACCCFNAEKALTSSYMSSLAPAVEPHTTHLDGVNSAPCGSEQGALRHKNAND